MNILMITNTYTPMIGGLERSVRQFAEQYRSMGHRTVIVAPRWAGMPKRERDVVRVPAVSRRRQSNFAIQVPIPGVLSRKLLGFRPDIVHAHHPFMLGSTALRIAYARNIPLVFTHHTLYEHYTHWMPVNLPGMKSFVARLAVGYANLCDLVFAPSQSVKDLLIKRGVRTPIAVVPTGLPLEEFQSGDRRRARQKLELPSDALVIGHVGRLGAEKNISFLSRAVGLFLHRTPGAYFLLVGDGPSREEVLAVCRRWGVEDRVRSPGSLRGRELVDAYHAMDLFVFSSKSETQGLVLLEAMAAGVPVAALEGPGVSDLVRNGRNGFLLRRENVEEFSALLGRFAKLSAPRRRAFSREAKRTAEGFSMERCAARALEAYRQVSEKQRRRRPLPGSAWARAMRWVQGEWRLVRNYTGAAGAALTKKAGAFAQQT